MVYVIILAMQLCVEAQAYVYVELISLRYQRARNSAVHNYQLPMSVWGKGSAGAVVTLVKTLIERQKWLKTITPAVVVTTG